MNREHGLTIIELVIVLAVISIVVTLAIPTLLRARQSAREASAIASLKAIAAAELLSTQGYKQLSDLATQAAIDPALASGSKSGYRFGLEIATSGNAFTCTATPIDKPLASYHFLVDQTGVVRFEFAQPATIRSLAIDLMPSERK